MIRTLRKDPDDPSEIHGRSKGRSPVDVRKFGALETAREESFQRQPGR